MKLQKLGRCTFALAMTVTGFAVAQMNNEAQSGAATVLKDDLASPGTVRASKLVGTEIYDPAGKDVGKIKDIVLDRNHNTVDYAVVSQGTAGLNEKLIALPYRALGYGGPMEDRVYVQVRKDVLDKAPGFDPDKWPIQANAAYYRSLDAYYDTRLSSAVTPPAPDQTAEAQKASATLPPSGELPWSRRVTKLIGRDVVSPSGEKLGTIKDLVLDTKTGDVRYAVLARGSGLGKQTFYAVPLNQFQTMSNDQKLALNVSAADLKTIPGFDTDHWPAQADPRWTTAKGEMTR